MKRLGTITMYYPFVDNETREAMDTLMNKAYNYHDFVTLLCQKALSTESSHTLVFLAYLHAFKLWEFEELNKLSRRFAKDPMIQPYHLWIRSYMGVDTDWDAVKKATYEVLSMDIGDWVAVEMNLLVLLSYGLQPHWGPEEDHALNELERLVNSNQDLACFASNVSYYLAITTDDMEPEKRRACLARALEVAEEYDDRLAVGNLQLDNAQMYLRAESDTSRAEDKLQLALKEYEHLGSGYGAALVCYSMGTLAEHCGQYNLSIRYYQEAMSYMERHSHPHEHIALALANAFNEIEDHDAALEYGEMGRIAASYIPFFSGLSQLQLARAKIGLGRLEEASTHLSTAKATVLKSGSELQLASYYLTAGLLHRAEGDLEVAIQIFGQSFEISQRNNDQRKMTVALLRLAETEVIRLHDTEFKQTNYALGPWLKELERVSQEKALPGFIGLALLLKAEIRFMEGQKEDGNRILREVWELANEPGLRYLEDKADDLKARADAIADY